MSRLLSFVCLLLACVAVHAGDWTVYSVGGRDYLSMDNIAEFYNLTDIRRTEKEIVVSSGVRSLRASLNSADFFINNLKFILSFPTIQHDGKICISRMDLVKLIEPVMRPSRIKNAPLIDTVVLDAGHGGHDNGAMSLWGPEKGYALDVVRRAKALLEGAGYNVVLTRSGDYFVPLGDRVRIANQNPRAIFISIHFNSGGWGTGVETYSLAPRGVPSMMSDGPSVSDMVECNGNARDAENMALATASHAALVVKTRMFDRGLKRARFVVIRDIAIPGVLLECGFQSNPYDGKMIATPLYRQTLAQAVLAAVENYKRAVGAQAAARPRPTPAPAPEDDRPPRENTAPAPAPTPAPAPAKKKPSKPAPIEPPKSK
jgi:N-acetylmuramoyl-L-alanine amidase